jgi:hypothetical protein
MAPVAGAPALGLNGLPALEGEAAAAGSMPVVPLLENYDLPPPGSAVDVMVDHLKVLAEKEPSASPKSSNNGCRKMAELNNNNFLTAQKSRTSA